MKKRKQSWGLIMGVSSSLFFTGVLTSLGMSGGAEGVYAAESSKAMTQAEAIQAAKKWVTIPADYKVERSTFLDAKRHPFYGQSSWQIRWENNAEDGIQVIIDAATGKLMQYSRYKNEDKPSSSLKKLPDEQVRKAAISFLQQVTTAEERQKLSEPNEYGSPSSYYGEWGALHLIHLTRIENGIPFLENGFRVVIDQDGEVSAFSREWYEGKLPDAKPVISLEEGQKLLNERAHPSLIYTEWNQRGGGFEQSHDRYRLVYRFDENDPQFVDATSGQVINALGLVAVDRKIKPLGTTIPSYAGEERILTKAEAQKIAEQIVKNLPGSYRSDGSRGGGASTGSDGIERQNWKFDFTPLHTKDGSGNEIRLRVGDRGELQEYEAREGVLFQDQGRKIEKGIPWEQAEASAVALVKALYYDRLGEVYLLEQRPSEADLKQLLEKGQSYRVLFGWQRDGVVIQDVTIEVLVDPETGEAEGLSARRDGLPSIQTESTAKRIEQTEATKVMQEQKEFKLTYYQPQNSRYAQTFEWMEPLLVYRYVGDDGMVDATSGEWISFNEADKNKEPQDIDEHPLKAALEFAVRMELLPVVDGKLEPDKPVTRGEMLQILSRLTNRHEFRYLRPIYSTDERKPYSFTDVDPKNRYYAVIQKGIQYNLIASEGTTFEPDRDITRSEAADMLARLLGYGSLLGKPEIFTSPYQDLQKKQIPAVALVGAQGILPGKSTTAFGPNAPLTRAEIAQLVQILLEKTKME